VISNFLIGFFAPLRGAALLWQTPKLRRLAILPFIFTTVIFIFGLSWGLPGLSHLISFIATRPVLHGSSSFLAILLQICLWPVGLMGLLLSLLVSSRVLVGPLYAVLADATLIVTGARTEAPFRLGDWIANSIKISVTALFRGLILAGATVVLFLFSLIPGFAVLASLAFLVMFASDLTDYALDSYRLGLKERFRFMREHFAALTGLGLAMGIIFVIPGLNFILMPVSIVGAADVVRRLKGAVREP
jgi:uncharacterized protein involved in cysteine biosynthesis